LCYQVLKYLLLRRDLPPSGGFSNWVLPRRCQARPNDEAERCDNKDQLHADQEVPDDRGLIEAAAFARRTLGIPYALAPVSCRIAVNGAATLSRDLRSALTPSASSTRAATTMRPAATRYPKKRLPRSPVPIS
jgi:hypothetical protein